MRLTPAQQSATEGVLPKESDPKHWVGCPFAFRGAFLVLMGSHGEWCCSKDIKNRGQGTHGTWAFRMSGCPASRLRWRDCLVSSPKIVVALSCGPEKHPRIRGGEGGLESTWLRVQSRYRVPSKTNTQVGWLFFLEGIHGTFQEQVLSDVLFSQFLDPAV